MKLSELKDILIPRVGWRDDKTVTGFTLSAANLESESGRHFQSEHSAVTLKNIRNCQPVPSISASDFNAYLEELRKQAVLQVLDDAFERDYVKDNLIVKYPTAFDSAILLRMVIVVGELIMTSSRSNNTERISKDFASKLNYDIFRESPNKFAIRGANYNHTLGVATRYGEELKSVQRRFGTMAGMLKTITKGEAYTDESLYRNS